MSAGLSLSSASQKAEEFMIASPVPEISSAISRTSAAEQRQVARAKSGLLSLGQFLSVDKPLRLGLLSIADQAVASATNFATGIIIARTCSQEELGLYMLGLTVILLSIDLQTSLISTPYIVYAPRLKGFAHPLYTGCTLVHQAIFSSLLVFVFACAALACRMGAGPSGLEPILWSLAGVITLIVLREYVRRICFARLRLLTAFAFDAYIAIAQIGGLLLLARFHMLSPSRAYWAIGSACGIALLAWLRLERESYQPRIDKSRADLKKNWGFGKWVLASGLVWTVSLNLYPWFLAAFHGTASAGVWAACMGVASSGNPVLIGIQNIVGPQIAHEYAAVGPKALRRRVLRTVAIVSLPLSLLCVALILWGGRLMTLLYGRQYSGNSEVVAVLALSLLISSPAFCFSRALYASECADLDCVASLAAFIVMITLGIWLVRALGPLGAAFGLLAGNFATLALKAGAYLRTQPRICANGEQTN